MNAAETDEVAIESSQNESPIQGLRGVRRSERVDSEIGVRRHLILIYALAASGTGAGVVYVGLRPESELPHVTMIALASLYFALAAIFLRAFLMPKLIETSAAGLTIHHPFSLKSEFIHWEQFVGAELNMSNSVLAVGARQGVSSRLIQIPFVALKPHGSIAARDLNLLRGAYFQGKTEGDAPSGALSLEAEAPAFEAPEAFFLSPFVKVVVFFSLAVTAFAIAAGVPWLSPPDLDLVRLGGQYPPLTVRGEWWRLISFGLLARGAIPLALEILALIVLSSSQRLFAELELFALYGAGLVMSAALAGRVHPYSVAVGGAGPLAALMVATVLRKPRVSPAVVVSGLLLALAMAAGEKLDLPALAGGLIAGVAIGLISNAKRAQGLFIGAGGVAALALAMVFLGTKPVDALGTVERTTQQFGVIAAFDQSSKRTPQTREECDTLDKEINTKEIQPLETARSELATLQVISEEPTHSQVQQLTQTSQMLTLSAKYKLAKLARTRRELVLNDDLRTGRASVEQAIAQITDQWMPEVRESEPAFISGLRADAAKQIVAEDLALTTQYLTRIAQLAEGALKRDLKADVLQSTKLLEANDPKDPRLELARAYIVNDVAAHIAIHQKRLGELSAKGLKATGGLETWLGKYAEAREAFNVIAVDYSLRRRFKTLDRAWTAKSLNVANAVNEITQELTPMVALYRLTGARVPASAGPVDKLALDRGEALTKFSLALKTGKAKNIRAVQLQWLAIDEGTSAAQTLAAAKTMIQMVATFNDPAW